MMQSRRAGRHRYWPLLRKLRDRSDPARWKWGQASWPTDATVAPRVQSRKIRNRRKPPAGKACLYPLESTFLVRPDVTYRQYDQKDSDFGHAKPMHLAIPDGPGEQEDGLHVEDHEQDGNDIKPDCVAAAGVGCRFNATFV